MKYLKTFENHAVYTNDKFWGTVGAGILPYCKETGRFLLAFRSEYVNEPHTWGIWGGKLDDMDTDDPKKAAMLELEEETGFKGNIKLIDAHVYRKENVFTYHNYIGLIDKEYEPVLNWESDGFKWVTIEELYSISPKHFGLAELLNESKDLIYSL